ncbi:MAG: hypothetical protein F2681_06400 [Actinobacteria bacterium]|jgi:hypothetical protein|uniref:Unannotated protein n=1 Tax=freshwater metagenome TaxID=449393 RepID=A0A6J6RFP1_9ZZZZ|nr:hypothetical protein [Actinomycetota bacterium]MSW77315.1 hypothetical protein [Actinomycetota bacterium]MSX55227.1 hypothetical protein [Actinomycetota bacterium]MSX92305.1 hypothetical protein [Actinomycetota bacterium]MSZ82754.1 hypothetical protein [Actinomycetota bacterium]
MTWVFIAVVVLAAVGFYWYGRRRHRQEPGVASFQRHIDALSSERRRESFERVRPQMQDDYDDETGS